MHDLSDRIAQVLGAAAEPLTSPEVAKRLNAVPEAVDRTLWNEPDRFAWQPGHRWTLAATKRTPRPADVDLDYQDLRAEPLVAREPVALRAITLPGGGTLKVISRPLDSQAVFAVGSVGTDVHLILNSAHELFAEFPMPFEGRESTVDDRRLLELLLEAWAVQESEAPPGPAKRMLEDVRLMWGRKVVELLAEGG
jgi:hypothetical protein